jgi:hypothetical protein
MRASALLSLLALSSLAACAIGGEYRHRTRGCDTDYDYDCGPYGGGSSSGSSGTVYDAGKVDARPVDGGTDARPTDAGRDAADASRDGAVDAAPDRDPCLGVVCESNNGTSTCVGGACVIVGCDPGYGDCDGNPANGCEPFSTFYQDADGDGHGVGNGATAAACTAPAGFAATTDDCDDTDGRAYPGQTSSYGTPRPSGSYDFDCDGAETQLNTRIDPQQCLCTGGVCAISRGWKDTVPACGVAADFALDPVTPDACDILYVSQTQVCR